ncbi:MAG: hypothetical protein JWP33_2681 [Blastococcus sp.]|nr:hypothetical protein [Blastococcus sp.]
MVVVASGMAMTMVLGQTAQAATTSLTTEDFATHSTGDNWVLPSSGTNTACLTAGTDTARVPVPACTSTGEDADGAGALRLTTADGNQVGTVYNSVSMPTMQGLDIGFNTYQYAATSDPGADGISFILAVTDPENPAPPAVKGPLGGALGYSPGGGNPGVSYGYLGFGLDVYGNYANSAYGGTGCPANPRKLQNITVRGPGNGTTGYCIQQTVDLTSGGLDERTSTARPQPVPVEIAVNPSASTTTTPGGLTVPAGSWAMRVTTYTGVQTLSQPLPSVAGLGFPAGWYDPATGFPYQLAFGWAASTGGNNEVHEINRLTSATLNGLLPVYDLSISDDESGTFLAGNRAVVRVRPGLDAAGGPESAGATVVTTFPAGLTPPSGTFTTDAGYACTTAGQVTTCRLTPPSPVPAGGSFPELEIPVTVPAGTAVGSYTLTSKVSSVDGNPDTARSTVTVSRFAASATPVSSDHGAAVTLAVTGPSADARGAIAFTDAAGVTLCTIPDVTAARSCGSTANAGSHAVTATFTPSAGSPYAAQTATTSFTVHSVTLAITASAAPGDTTFGERATLAVHGLAADASGPVTFTAADGDVLCAIPDVADARSCRTDAAREPGRYAITAAYAGDVNYHPATAATALTVSRAVPPIAALSGTVLTAGSVHTLSFSGLPTTGALAATGTVTFTDAGGAELCTVTLPGTSCQTARHLADGSHQVVARYSGDGHYAAVTSSAVTFVVAPPNGPVAALLAITGVPVLGLAIGGGTMVGLGVAVLARARRFAR